MNDTKIKVKCQCGFSKKNIPKKLLGKKLKCPKCGDSIKIVEESQSKIANILSNKYFIKLSNKYFITFFLIGLLIIFQSINYDLSFDFQVSESQEISTGNYLSESMNKTSKCWVIARAINAGISILQSSQISCSFLGVGGAISFGEVFDPINDIIERLSWVLVASMISIGIQMFILKLIPWITLKIFLSLSIVFFIFQIFFGERYKYKDKFNFKKISIKLVIISVFLYLIIPSANYLNQFIYEAILQPTQQETQSKLESFKQKFSIPNNLSFKEKAKYAYKITKSVNNVAKQICVLAMIVIITYVIQTIILPIGTLLILIWFFKNLFDINKKFNIEQKLYNKILGGS